MHILPHPLNTYKPRAKRRFYARTVYSTAALRYNIIVYK